MKIILGAIDKSLTRMKKMKIVCESLCVEREGVLWRGLIFEKCKVFGKGRVFVWLGTWRF